MMIPKSSVWIQSFLLKSTTYLNLLNDNTPEGGVKIFLSLRMINIVYEENVTKSVILFSQRTRLRLKLFQLFR